MSVEDPPRLPSTKVPGMPIQGLRRLTICLTVCQETRGQTQALKSGRISQLRLTNSA